MRWAPETLPASLWEPLGAGPRWGPNPDRVHPRLGLRAGLRESRGLPAPARPEGTVGHRRPRLPGTEPAPPTGRARSARAASEKQRAPPAQRGHGAPRGGWAREGPIPHRPQRNVELPRRPFPGRAGDARPHCAQRPRGHGQFASLGTRAPRGARCSRMPSPVGLSGTTSQQYSRLNSSSQANSLRDLLQSQMDDLERQVLSRVNALEEGRGAPKNDTEERVKIESALSALHQRISELEKGQKDSRPGDKFQLTFPLRTNYMYAKVKKSLPEMYAFTVCMWLKSSAAPGVGTPFSYAVPGQANELVLIEWGNNPMEILINDKVAKLPFVINDGKWHHICITWTTRDGVWEAYQDGTQGGSGENLAPYHPIKPQGVLVLGQEQDTLGGGFDATQAFVGELAHFNIWDRKLTPGEVYNLATCSTKALPGNVIAWAESHIEIYGGATKWTFEACRQIN
uniref:Neuronal pentraxin 1 n=1 Tax=Oryctolagus cuniculus TaxID=9986 RepID=G1T4G4_RABIT